MSQADWSARVAQVIAGEVRRHRGARKMSARQLAERCAELGMEIPQPVLANLENGRRPLVSVAELLVLAAALDVPPVVLIAPLGYQEETEILPGRRLDTWDAVRWQSGEARLADDSGGARAEPMRLGDDGAVVPLYYRHQELVDECEADWESSPWVKDKAGNVVMESADMYAAAVDRLRQHRALMEQRGLLLPALPSPLAEHVTAEPPTRRRRHQA